MSSYSSFARQTQQMMRCCLVAVLLLANLSSCATASRIDDARLEHDITFFTSYGYQREGSWHIPFRVWVNESPNTVRELTARGARRLLRNVAHIEELSEHQKARYLWRVRDFVANSKSERVVSLMFDHDPEKERFLLQGSNGESETDFNGVLQGTLTIGIKKVRQLMDAQNSHDNWLSFQTSSGEFEGRGRVQLVPHDGLTVISDIDDTTRITGITQGSQVVVDNVFFSDYKAAPCMAPMYRSLEDDAVFHYVSGAPWQLYEPTTDFLFSEPAEFPHGSVHMKNVRTNFLEKDSFVDFWKLTGLAGSATIAQKTRIIENILRHFPEREFILIGDSGEHDPEIFADMRSRYPEQIHSIRIRDVVNAAVNQPARLADMMIIPPDAASCS